MSDMIKIKRALVSVSDKTGLVEFAKSLNEMGIEIISTGGTLAKLKEAGIQAISVSTFTGAPEILGGRVKTLHPKVHAGILFRRGLEEDETEIATHEYKAVDMVVVNLYPFEKTVAKKDVTEAEAVEKIDIGGPTMVRAAAKNFDGVLVVTSPADYGKVTEELKKNDGSTGKSFRKEMASRAFVTTADYEKAISGYFNRENDGKGLAPGIHFNYKLKQNLRYGENPHQQAAFYIDESFEGPSLSRAEQLAGKELSFNNFADLDACLDMLIDFKEPFACVLKHANPCGAAIGDNVTEAYVQAYESDPLSAFGSIIGLNRKVDMEVAEQLHKTHFVECILAPDFDEDALAKLRKKKNRRLLRLPEITKGRPEGEMYAKFVRGGLLYQSADDHEMDPKELKVVTKRQPTEAELKSLLFAWKVVKHTKSNAIVLVRGNATVGIGMGQTSRVDAGFLAVKRAGDRAKGAVMASDAFYPMPDGIEVGTDAGVTAIIQPGGSKGDPEAIAAADKAGAAMVFTGVRHFKH